MNTNPNSQNPPTHRGVNAYNANNNSQSASDQNYQSYSSYSGAQGQNDSVLKLERDMAIQEFKDDRDFIIETLKQNIKNHEYEEAQLLIQQYRAALKIDETFAMLATMVKEGIEKNKKIEKFETQLELTPEDDYLQRMKICQDILVIVPDCEKYQAEIARCQRELDRISQNNRNIRSNNKTSQSEDILACPGTAITLIILDALIILGTIGDGNPSAIVYYLIAIGLHFVICSNIKANPLKKLPDGLKIALSIILFFIGGAFL